MLQCVHKEFVIKKLADWRDSGRERECLPDFERDTVPPPVSGCAIC
ncbi:hypothetical protein [Sporolactobacillus putidus]|nr:hypothetical protein [Sporolactobacillus putidus]